MKGELLAAMAAAIRIGALLAGTGQYTHWAQPPKGPQNKPGNSLAKARKKAKARRTAQRAARKKAKARRTAQRAARKKAKARRTAQRAARRMK